MNKYSERLCVAVCDDDRVTCDRLVEQVTEIFKEEQVEAEVSRYGSGTELLRDIQKGARFQILLLDVVMPELSGLELAATLRNQRDETAIIFISSNVEMALRGYEVSALRFLAKPIAEDKLREALQYCFSTCCKQKEALLPTDKGQSRVRLSEIVYAESQNRCTRLTLTSGKLIANLMISELGSMLPGDQFIFCHRTVLVNLSYVQSISRDGFEMKTGERLPISKYRLPEVKARLLTYLGR